MTIPTSTLAAVLTEHGAALELQELPLPERVEPGAALVRITCTTLCGTDIEIWAGKMSFPGMLPMVLGHEMVGEVVAVGEGAVDALGELIAVGDRIGWSESVCGECFGCTVLRQPVACSRRGYGFLQRSDVPPYATAGLSEYAYVTPGAQKLRLPAEVKDTWASAAGCAAKTVLRAFERAGGVRPGSRVVVQGSGALGLFATAVASISGAGTVITVGAPAARLELAQRFGADHTVDIGAQGSADDAKHSAAGSDAAGSDNDATHSTADGRTGSEATVARVMELTDGQGADLVLDFAGAPGVGPDAIGMAAQRGTFVVVGSTGPAGDPIALSEIMRKELTVVGSLNGDVSDYFRSIEFFRTFADRFPWDELFSEPCGLEEASDRIANMHRLGEVKAVIDPRLGKAV